MLLGEGVEAWGERSGRGEEVRLVRAEIRAAEAQLDEPVRWTERCPFLGLAARFWVVDPEPHRTAIRRLVEAGHPDAALPLAKVLADKSFPYRVEAAEALRHVPNQFAVPMLIQALTDTDPDVREQAPGSLAAIVREGGLDAGRVKEIIQRLAERLREDSRLAVRYAAYRALLETGTEQGMLLGVGLASSDRSWFKSVLGCANLKNMSYFARASGKASSIRSTAEFIAQTLKEGTDPLFVRFGLSRAYLVSRYGCASARVGAVEGVGLLGDPSATSALVRIVQVESDARLRAAAVGALGEVGGDAAFPVLVGVLEDRNPQVRRTAMQALVRLGDPRGGERLAAILRQGSTYDRLGAAAALEAFPAHTPALIRALGDEVAQVRRAAELALVRQAEPGAIPMLVKVLSGPDEQQGEGAMRVLASYKGEESRKSLLEVLRRGPPQGARLAALALGLRGEPESRCELEQALVDFNYPEAVSIAVVHALEDLNQPASLPLLKRLAKTAYSPTLRTAAGQAAAFIEGG